MSLRVDWTALKDPATGDYPDWMYVPDPETPDKMILNPITNILGFLMVPLKFQEITPANVDEFYTRLLMFSALFGAPLQREDGKDYTPTYDEVKRHIGLKSNVAAEGKQAFNAWLIRSLRERAAATLKKQKLSL